MSYPRIVKDRKIAIIFVFLLAILSLAKGAITERFLLMKLIFWILPPIWEISCVFANVDYLDFDKMVVASGILLLSSAFLTIVKIKFLEKEGFNVFFKKKVNVELINPVSNDYVLKYDNIEIEPKYRITRVNGIEIKLTNLELEILYLYYGCYLRYL